MNRDEDSTDILWIIALCFAAAPGVGTLAVYLVNVISLDKMLRYLSLCPLPIGCLDFGHDQRLPMRWQKKFKQ